MIKEQKMKPCKHLNTKNGKCDLYPMNTNDYTMVDERGRCEGYIEKDWNLCDSYEYERIQK